MKPKVKSDVEKRRLKEKQQLEKTGSDPKQKKLMFFKTSEVQKVSTNINIPIYCFIIFVLFFTKLIHPYVVK
jgi:hypothetical protein